AQPPSRRRAGAAHGLAMSSWAPWCLPINLAVAMREACTSRVDFRRFGALVFEALANLCDVLLRHQLGTRVQVGGGNAAIDLQVKLHDRPEALQEGLLSQRTGQVSGGDSLLLCRAEVEPECAELAG